MPSDEYSAFVRQLRDGLREVEDMIEFSSDSITDSADELVRNVDMFEGWWEYMVDDASDAPETVPTVADGRQVSAAADAVFRRASDLVNEYADMLKKAAAALNSQFGELGRELEEIRLVAEEL